MSRPPKGRSAGAPSHSALSGTPSGGPVPYQDLAPYLGANWFVPDLANEIGDFGYPAYQLIGNKVYLYGQVQYRGTAPGSEASSQVLVGLPTDTRPENSTPIKIFENTVSSDMGLWGPGFWDAVASTNGSVSLGASTNTPYGVPATDEGTVVTLVLEGVEWTRAAGSDIPISEELLLAPYLNAAYSASADEPPKLIRRGAHVGAQGVVVTEADGVNLIADIPEDWCPKDFTRALVTEGIPPSSYTHWYGIVSLFGDMSVNNSTAYQSTWHYFLEGAPFDRREYALFSAGGFYAGETFWTTGSPPTDVLFDTIAQKDWFQFSARFNLEELEDNPLTGLFWNNGEEDGYTLEFVDQSPTLYGLRLYVFHGATRTLLSQRNNIAKSESLVVSLTIRVWWTLVSAVDPGGPRRVFIEVDFTGGGMNFNHRTDGSPAAISDIGETGTITIKPDRSRGEIKLLNSPSAFGAPQAGDSLRLHGSWIGNIEAAPEPGDVRAGVAARGMVRR